MLLHSGLVLAVVTGPERGAQTLGWVFVDFRRGRRLIPALCGADGAHGSLLGVDGHYHLHRDLGPGLCWNLVTLNHNLCFF